MLGRQIGLLRRLLFRRRAMRAKQLLRRRLVADSGTMSPVSCASYTTTRLTVMRQNVCYRRPHLTKLPQHFLSEQVRRRLQSSIWLYVGIVRFQTHRLLGNELDLDILHKTAVQRILASSFNLVQTFLHVGRPAHRIHFLQSRCESGPCQQPSMQIVSHPLRKAYWRR